MIYEWFISKFIASQLERIMCIRFSKSRQRRSTLLANFVKRFQHDVILIPNLKDRVSHTSFLNGMKNGLFKFFLAE